VDRRDADASATGDNKMLLTTGANNGFTFTVPAGTTTQTLLVRGYTFNTDSTFTAHLSDSSAPDYTVSVDYFSQQDGLQLFTLNYKAASAGQTLTLTWTF